MGSVNMTSGLVKKETMIVGVVVALAVGFLAGVVYSSFKAPLPVPVSKDNKEQSPAGQQLGGATADQSAKIASLELEVGRNSGNGAAWTQLGNLYFDTNQPIKAIAAYNKSLAINQGQPDVWTDLGVMYRSNRQFKEAVGAFDRAIALNPAMEQAYFNKGIVLLNDLGDKTGGIEAWQKTLTINPEAKSPDGQLVKNLLASIK